MAESTEIAAFAGMPYDRQPIVRTGTSSVTVNVPDDVPTLDLPPNFCADDEGQCPADDPRPNEADRRANWGLHHHYGPDAVTWLHLGDAEYRPLSVESALSLASALKWWAEKVQREEILRHAD